MRRDGAVLLAAAVVLSLAACGFGSKSGAADEPVATIRIAPLTPRDPHRIPPPQRAAIDALADEASSQAPPAHEGDDAHDGNAHGAAGATVTAPLDGMQEATFREQWAAAVAAVADLDTPNEASASAPDIARCPTP